MIQNNQDKILYKTSIDLSCRINNKKSFSKAVSDYMTSETNPASFGNYMSPSQDISTPTDTAPMPPQAGDFDKISPLKNLILRQPDLLYIVSTFASQGANKNWDGFLRPVLARIFETAENKFVDYEHDVDAEDPDKNPEQYEIVGHIYDSSLATQETGTLIPDYEVYFDDDGKLFCKDSPYRNQGIDVMVAWVLYQFQYPELADLVVKEFEKGDDGKFGVSMEILFSDFKYRVGKFDPNEEFDFDATSVGEIEARKGSSLADELKPYWENRRLYNGKPVTRIFGGQVFFSGMAITSNRASMRSSNKALASLKEVKETKTNKEFLALVTAVASKNKEMNMSNCKIVNGEPDCECLESAIAAQLNSMAIDMSKLKEWLDKKRNEGMHMFNDGPIDASIKKREDVNPKEGKSKYGNVKFADPVNKKYPIDTAEHIRAAWNYINHPKNSGKYSSNDSGRIKSRIISAWKKHIDKAGPPSASKADLKEYFDNIQEIEKNDIMAHLTNANDYLEKANMYLKSTKDTGIDNEIDYEDVMDSLAEIEDLLDQAKEMSSN